MKSRPVWMMPVVALLLVASWGGVWADTSDVKGAAPVIVAKSGKHCKDDPNCFNRISLRNQAGRPCKAWAAVRARDARWARF